MPPKPMMESKAPVRPRALFSIPPGALILAIPLRSAGKRLITGAASEAVLMKSRRFIIVFFKRYKLKSYEIVPDYPKKVIAPVINL
jgi:hypothetical protein